MTHVASRVWRRSVAIRFMSPLSRSICGGSMQLRCGFCSNNNGNNEIDEWLRSIGLSEYSETIHSVFGSMRRIRHLSPREFKDELKQHFQDKNVRINIQDLADFGWAIEGLRKDLSSIDKIFDWIRNEVMAGEKEEDLMIGYDLPGSGLGWGDEYLDDGYYQLLDQVCNEFDNFICQEKTMLAGKDIRDTAHTVYGIPGSGKSTFLMQRKKRMEKDHPDILPIIITFNDKCNYSVPHETTVEIVWQQIVARIGFSLFGDNTRETFTKILNGFRSDVTYESKLFFKELEWSRLVFDTIDYVNNVRNKNYCGISLLIDEILRTSKNDIEMDEQFLAIFRDGRDTHRLTRKELSFLFTTLNSYSWIVKESGESKRVVKTYYLPHFSDKTVCQQLAGIAPNRMCKALYSSVLINFRPRYMREIIHNYKNEDTLARFDNSNKINEKTFGMNDQFWEDIKSKLSFVDDKIFDLSFLNKECQFNDILISGYRACDLVATGIIIPYKGLENRFDLKFIPQISMLAIVNYLETKESKLDIEKKLFELITNYIEIGNSFEKFHLLFETFRFNSFVHKNEKNKETNVRDYFGGRLHFCNNYNEIAKKKLLLEGPKMNLKEVRVPFEQFMDDLNGLCPKVRQDYLLDNVFWFCGDATCQAGFDSLIVYETMDNQLLLIFLESKYEKPRNPQYSRNDHGILELSNIQSKASNFYDITNNSKYKHNSYQWFNNASKLLIYCDYKDFDIDLHAPKLSDKIYHSVAIFAEDIGQEKSQITKHFGPTWKHILSHYIGQQYPKSSKQSKLF